MKANIILFLILGILYSCKKEKHLEHIPQKAIHIDTKSGTEWNVFGVKITGKVMSTNTNGDYAVIMSNTPSQGGPPLHVHEHEDELFYVLKGKYIFTCGEEEIYASEGSLVRLPKGIPHKFKNIDSIEGITMNTITPGGFENFFNDIATLSQNKKVTKQKVDSIAKSYGLKFLK